METTKERLRRFHSDFSKLQHNREKVPMELLKTKYERAYNTLVAEVLDGADWFYQQYMKSLAFPTHPRDIAGNEWLANRIASILREEREPGRLTDRYRAALIDRLDMGEFKQLVWERYERLRQEAYNPYWARHCYRLDSGWIYNDILQKFWLPSESGKSGGWSNSDYTGWDSRFPPVMKEEHHG